MGKQIELKIGEEYSVNLFPRKDNLPAKYIGEAKGNHFFRIQTPSGRQAVFSGYVCLDGDVMVLDRNGVLTHGSYRPSVCHIPEESTDPNHRWYVQKIRKLEGAMR